MELTATKALAKRKVLLSQSTDGRKRRYVFTCGRRQVS